MYGNACFVDTGGWFALFVLSDPEHQRVTQAIAGAGRRLITTDYVVDELLTLLRMRKQSQQTSRAWQFLHTPSTVELLHITEHDTEVAWQIFECFADKAWSLTDCTSKQMIDTLGIPYACSLDDHFRQFGTVTVLPT